MAHYNNIYFLSNLLLICIISVIIGCNSLGSKNSNSKYIEIPRKADGSIDYDKLPLMSFSDTRYDFGHIQKNAKARHAFIFKNTGHVPLIISDVNTSCGCTTPIWPRHVIGVGATDSIVVEYNSEGRQGAFNKGVSIISNTYPNETILAIKGYTDN